MAVAAPERPTWRWSLALAGVLMVLPIAARAGQTEFKIEAGDFHDGNVRVSQIYILNAGELPNWAEYEIEVPVVADCTLFALYAAAQSRPVEIGIDGKKVHTGCRSVTGRLRDRRPRG